MAQDDRLVAFQVPVAQRGGAATVEIDRLGGSGFAEDVVQIVVGCSFAPFGLPSIHRQHKQVLVVGGESEGGSRVPCVVGAGGCGVAVP